MTTEIITFIVLVFSSVFLLILTMGIPVFGENKQYRRKIKQRIDQIRSGGEIPNELLTLRKKQQENLNSLEISLENSPILSRVKNMIEQSGRNILAYQLVAICLTIALATAFFIWLLSNYVVASVSAALIAFCLPLFKINMERQQRLAKFDEQLPEAIDVMKRALRAGHPFSESIHLVAEELDEPIKREFTITFAELNYGSDLRWAMLGLLERIQSVNVMALVTAVLVQRETGGNLAEILDNLSKVIRGRFRFHRKVKTLSAEGRLSAWILSLVPFVLFLMIHFTTPSYLPILVESELGKNLIFACVLMMAAGMYWISRIIRIEV